MQLNKWIEYGAEKEDEPNCRASNHFHNPYNPVGQYHWQNAGLSDLWWPMIPYCALEGWQGDFPTGKIRSNITWATGCLDRDCIEKDAYSSTANRWNWDSARNYFFAYLTGRDVAGNFIALNRQSRDLYLADALRSLGQTLHLLQDTAVPAHVRDDFSQGHLMVMPGLEYPKKWVGNDLEKYVERHDERWWFFGTSPINSGFTDMRLTDLWDTDQLESGHAPGGLGLAESTSLNFLSTGSAFKPSFPFPQTNHCAVAIKDPPAGTGSFLGRLYVYATSLHPGEKIEHLAVVSYLKYFRDVFIDLIASGGLILNRENDPYYMDANCHEDYAASLIPKAIGYSADLLNFFFRGRMEATALPYFLENSLYAMKLSITNATPSQEEMAQGTFSLLLRYRPQGANEDGSEDIFVPAHQSLPVDSLRFNETTELLFYIDGTIPIDRWDTIQATITFSGTLGNEIGAVAAKVFTPGRVLFNEEWDKGLVGNHPWQSSADVQNSTNGVTLRTVEESRLVMENLRYDVSTQARTNDLWVELADQSAQGVRIGPNTFLQFKIDEMTSVPADPIGASHIMMFEFNNGLTLQYTEAGPFLPWNPTTLYLRFTPGMIISDNIHMLFASAGIAIPDPFILTDISFLQQVFDVPGEFRLRLLADHIRIVDQDIE